MTVAELIKKLSKFDPKAHVVTLDAYCDCVYIQKIYTGYDYKTDENVVILSSKGD